MPVGGGVVIGCTDNSREKRTFAQRQLPEVLSKIDHASLRKSSNTKTSAISQVHFVRVHLKNPLLRKALFQLKAQHRFGDLSPPVAIRAQEERPRHLHGNRARPLQVRTVPQVRPGCAKNADKVETRMLEESLVFRGQNRVHQVRWQVVIANRAPLLSGTVKQVGDELRFDFSRH